MGVWRVHQDAAPFVGARQLSRVCLAVFVVEAEPLLNQEPARYGRLKITFRRFSAERNTFNA